MAFVMIEKVMIESSFPFTNIWLPRGLVSCPNIYIYIYFFFGLNSYTNIIGSGRVNYYLIVKLGIPQFATCYLLVSIRSM